MEVIPDLVRGQIRRDSSGWSATRVFDVKVPEGGDPETVQWRVTQDPRIPKYGDPHKVIPGITVSNISVDHDDLRDGYNFDVTVEYSGDSEGTAPGLESTGIKGIEVSTSTITAQTIRDASGKLMLVKYEGPEFVIGGFAQGMWSPGTPDQVVRFAYENRVEPVEYELPTVTVSVTRERNRPSHVASVNSATYTNAGKWSGLGAKRWLSLGIDSTLNSNGKYDWRYQFAIAPPRIENMTWMYRAEPVVRDDTTGYSVKASNTVGNGIEFFNIYQAANFKQKFGFEIPS